MVKRDIDIGSVNLRKLEDIFGQECLEKKELFFKDESCMMSLGHIEEENDKEGYVKTERGYVYPDMSWGYHYVRR